MAREVILRLQYPEEIGAVGKCELEGILKKLQQAECLWNYECTLGSPITNSGSDSTDSAAKQGPRKGAVLLAVDGNVTESYYCRTAPAWNDPNIQERDSEQCNAKATSPFKPTILVEMYTTFTPTVDEETKITQAVHDTMMECLVQLKGLSPDSIIVRVMKYANQ